MKHGVDVQNMSACDQCKILNACCKKHTKCSALHVNNKLRYGIHNKQRYGVH